MEVCDLLFIEELKNVMGDPKLNTLVFVEIGSVIDGFQQAQLGNDVKENMKKVKHSMLAMQEKIKKETGRDLFVFESVNFLKDVQDFILTITNEKDLI